MLLYNCTKAGPFVNIVGHFSRSHFFGTEDGGSKWRIKFVHNERVRVVLSCEASRLFARLTRLVDSLQEIIVPNCEDMYCPYERFKEIYKEQPLQCNFDEWCGIAGPSTPTPDDNPEPSSPPTPAASTPTNAPVTSPYFNQPLEPVVYMVVAGVVSLAFGVGLGFLIGWRGKAFDVRRSYASLPSEQIH